MKNSILLIVLMFYSCQLLSENNEASLESVRPSDHLSTSYDDKMKKNESRFLELELSKVTKVLDGLSLSFLNICEKDIKSIDYSANLLAMIENTNCEWQFYSILSQNPKRQKYYNRHILDARILYDRNTKFDYTKAETNVIWFNDKNEKKYLTNKVVFFPNKGKRNYSFLNPKKLMLHKHLGPRNGCKMKIKFIEDDGAQLFRDRPSEFEILELIHSGPLGTVFIKMKNTINQDILYLKSINRSIDALVSDVNFLPSAFFKRSTSPFTVFSSKKNLSTKKKKGYYAGTITSLSTVGLLGGGLAVYFLFDELIEKIVDYLKDKYLEENGLNNLNLYEIIEFFKKFKNLNPSDIITLLNPEGWNHIAEIVGSEAFVDFLNSHDRSDYNTFLAGLATDNFSSLLNPMPEGKIFDLFFNMGENASKEVINELGDEKLKIILSLVGNEKVNQLVGMNEEGDPSFASKVKRLYQEVVQNRNLAI